MSVKVEGGIEVKEVQELTFEETAEQVAKVAETAIAEEVTGEAGEKDSARPDDLVGQADTAAVESKPAHTHSGGENKKEEGLVEGVGDEEKKGASVEDIMSDPSPPEKGVSLKAQDRIEKKIGTAIKERNIARDEAVALREENQRLKSSQTLGDRPVPPNPNAFDDESEYNTAMTQWKDSDDEWKVQSGNVKKLEQGDKDRWDNNIEDYKTNKRQRMVDRYPESLGSLSYVEVVEKGKNKYGSLNTLILGRKHAPEIAYYLGVPQNRKELDSIKALSPTDAVLAIGELSGLFKSVEKRTSTKALPPITPVEGSEGGPKDPFSVEEIDKWSKDILETY